MGENNSIGGLWLKDGKNGKFLAGKITIEGTDHQIVVFKNDRKAGKQPDYRIFASKPREGSGDASPDESTGDPF